ncbi:MAG TPA: AraC family transcriptional regulator [Fodinibius sp.]|nr:AraC family transcriptional regulator [Fodinibius sp.]
MEKLQPLSYHHDLTSFTRELYQLLSRAGISASGNRPANSQSRSVSDLKIQPKIGRVIVYIEEHLSEQLSLEKLAEEAHLNKYQLIRLFRKEQNTTPWKFLIGKRIDKAKEMLEKGIAPGQIAVETGFYDQPHFSRSFREETGRTPKEYQKLFISQN